MVRELRGHVGAVHAVVFNRDGNNIISGGLDGCMRIWDVPKQTCTLALNLRSGPLNAIAASRDGSILATCTESTPGEQKGASIQVNSCFPPPAPHDPHFFQIWSAHSFSRLASLPTKGPAKCVCVAGDSPYMVGAGDALGNVCVCLLALSFPLCCSPCAGTGRLTAASPPLPLPQSSRASKSCARLQPAPFCSLLCSHIRFWRVNKRSKTAEIFGQMSAALSSGGGSAVTIYPPGTSFQMNKSRFF